MASTTVCSKIRSVPLRSRSANLEQRRGPDCLKPPQVEAARKIYAGPSNPRTGQNIFPGLEPGSELGWATLTGPKPMSLAVQVYQYLVFQKPEWNYLDFDPVVDIRSAVT